MNDNKKERFGRPKKNLLKMGCNSVVRQRLEKEVANMVDETDFLILILIRGRSPLGKG
jgi:hypothetical protein